MCAERCDSLGTVSCSSIQRKTRVSLPSEVEMVPSVVGEHPVDVCCSDDPNDVGHGHLMHLTRRHHQEEEVAHQHSHKQNTHTPVRGGGGGGRNHSPGMQTLISQKCCRYWLLKQWVFSEVNLINLTEPGYILCCSDGLHLTIEVIKK